MGYDSKQDTLEHIEHVSGLMCEAIDNLRNRRESHDASKLVPPEKTAFDEFTPRLKELTYGSEEYKLCLDAMRPALEHHYAENSHHPEHYPDGIDGMDLLDVLEMLCDWKAATLRHADGDIIKSLEINRVRFGVSGQLYGILKNTVDRMGWTK